MTRPSSSRTARRTVGTAALALAFLAGGTAAGVALLSAGPGTPPAEAARGTLTPFDDCAALRRWYADQALPLVTAWGWGGPRMYPMGALASGAPAAAAGGAERQGDTATPSRTSSSTGTNTQEAGIDEPDVAKTDGRIVVRLVAQHQVVITDVSGPTPRQLGSWTVPDHAYADGLLLVGDHVLLTSRRPWALAMATPGAAEGSTSSGSGPTPRIAPQPGEQSGPTTTLVDLDISDPANPTPVSTTTYTGTDLTLRQQGSLVRLVLSSGLPQLPFVQPGDGTSAADALAHNRALVQDATVQDWLPQIVTGDAGTTGRGRPLVGCGDVYHPAVGVDGSTSGAELDTVSVSTFRPGSEDQPSAVALTASGEQVYASTDRLYVTSTEETSTRVERTDVHAFALDSRGARYLASGVVAGTLRDSWSLDEHDHFLRLALTQGPVADAAESPQIRPASDNSIVVLREDGDRLVQAGAVHGLGRGEVVQSVRWFDDLAIVVTFRQTDPVWTVDLRDPTAPRVRGELSTTGFSSYLHPIGGGQLLGLGTAADDGGTVHGAQVASFDVGDLAHPTLLDRIGFGDQTSPSVAEDPHAFTWLPDTRTAVTTLQDWAGRSQGAVPVAVSVAGDGHLSTRTLPSPGGWDVRALPLSGGRIALVGDRVEVLPAP